MLTLTEQYPDLAKQYSDSNQKGFDEYSRGSNAKVEWVCIEDTRHVWKAQIAKRTLGRGCPYCAGTKVLPGVNDFATLHPDKARHWSPNNPKGPENYSPMSDHKALFLCDNGHETITQIKARTIGRGCSVCTGRVAHTGVNDLKTLHPEISSEWSPSNPKGPSEYLPMSNKKVEWVCGKGHLYSAIICNRVIRNTGCPLCSGNRSVMSAEELETLAPEYGKMWGAKNREEDLNSKGRRGRFWLKCSNGLDHEYMTTLPNIHRGKGCAVCRNRQVAVGYNDAATTHPHLKPEWVDRNGDMESYVAGSNKIFWWRCTDGHEWETSLNHRAYGDETGCPVCSMRSSKIEIHMSNILEEYGSVVRQAKTTSVWTTGRRMNVDAVLEGKVCFEYDGRYWHKGREESDTYKTKTLLNSGYVVVRFRDRLDLLPITHENLLQIPITWVRDSEHIEGPVRSAMEWVVFGGHLTK